MTVYNVIAKEIIIKIIELRDTELSKTKIEIDFKCTNCDQMNFTLVDNYNEVKNFFNDFIDEGSMCDDCKQGYFD